MHHAGSRALKPCCAAYQLGGRESPGDGDLGRRLLAVAQHHRKRVALDIDATAALREVVGAVRLQEGKGLNAGRRLHRRDRRGRRRGSCTR